MCSIHVGRRWVETNRAIASFVALICLTFFLHMYVSRVCFFFVLLFTSGWFVRASICEMTFNNKKKPVVLTWQHNASGQYELAANHIFSLAFYAQETGKYVQTLLISAALNTLNPIIINGIRKTEEILQRSALSRISWKRNAVEKYFVI